MRSVQMLVSVLFVALLAGCQYADTLQTVLPEPESAYGGDRAAALPARPKVKGIYVSGWAAGTAKLDRLIELVEQTELNAMVIDMKTDRGQLTYDSALPMADDSGADSARMIPDISGLVAQLKEKQIYTIGRVVVFKDPYMAAVRPDWALQTKDGGVWQDSKGTSWVDPYHPEVWTYALDIAKEAASMGFDEVQFDYVRFPDNGLKVDREVVYRNPNGWAKSEAIERFLHLATEELHKRGVYVSADVFGLTASVSDDMGIGQVWNGIAPAIDVISPMIYPSHYGEGVFGIPHPDLEPYLIVQHALADGLRKNGQLASTSPQVATIRPWLQDFTATWVKPHKTYDNTDVQAQIQAAEELGIEEYLLWNSASSYTFR
ncbi:putative glycoside hydrolase [Paenibacillus ginsengarvi]|nr:putative glycoside hydrolase [Paenibacillus ginsengarvi]